MSTPATQLRSRVPRIAGAAVERARLRVVPRTRAVRAARVPFVLFVSLILLVGVVGLLMFNTSMQQASFAMGTYQERATSLAAREEQLTAELEGMRDPESLARKAQRIDMVPPACTPYLNTGSGEVVGEVCATPPGPGLRLGDRPPVVPRELDPPDRVVIVAPSAADARGSADARRDRGDEKQDRQRTPRNRNR